MAQRNLQKWHGARNVFLVEVNQPDEAPWWTPERVRAICDRTSGIGADGVIIATLDTPVAMVLYNADGSIAEMSGNGIRCLAGAVRRSTNASWTSLEVQTGAGLRTVTLTASEGLTKGSASVAMGHVTLGEVLAGTLGTAQVGNPHVVVADDAAWTDAEREVHAEQWATMMGGANVEFVRVIDSQHIVLRVIERGVGWTAACGTGSCASVAVLHRLGLVGNDVAVDNPGGTLHVELNNAFDATLSGPFEYVDDVEWPTE